MQVTDHRPSTPRNLTVEALRAAGVDAREGDVYTDALGFAWGAGRLKYEALMPDRFAAELQALSRPLELIWRADAVGVGR